MKHGDHYDYNIRQWVLDSAVHLNKKGTPASKIVKDAQTLYKFIFPENGKVSLITEKADNSKKT